MQLSFLGKSYTTSLPTIEAIDTQETAKFLGRAYTKKSFNVVQHQQTKAELTFLGRHYSR
jgi:hypothetical protein